MEGIQVNDINFRGQFIFSRTEKTKIVWRHTDSMLGELDAGDKVAVTFKGEIKETSAVQIEEIKQIQLLDDELDLMKNWRG